MRHNYRLRYTITLLARKTLAMALKWNYLCFFLIAYVANIIIIIVAEDDKAPATAPFPPCGEELRDISTFPGEERYNQSLVMYNPAFSHLHPSFFALPQTEQDVQRCLKCSVENFVPIAVRGGGHHGLGYSTLGSEGFVIYLSEMDQVVIDDASKIIHVGAGTRMGAVYKKMDSDYLLPGGLCPAVGVSGFTLGGGYSMLSRYLGLTIDNLVSITMVTANGSSVVVANSTVHPDLFWALRGGGGGNFGVVTRFTFRLHPAQPNYVFGAIKYRGDQIHDFLKLLKTALQFPKELHLETTLFPEQELTLEPLYVGEYSDALELLKPYIEISSSVDLKNFSSYLEIHKHAGEPIPAISPLPEMLRACVLKEMSDQAAKFFSEIKVPESCQIALDHFGGVVNEVAPDETAYPHRNASFYYYAQCWYSKATQYDRMVKFEDELFDSLIQGGHCAGGYINDIDRQVSDWQHFYYGGNYERLVEIKQAWNPRESGMLHFRHEIGSDYQPRSLGDESWKFSAL
jgi:hypothetical protein